MTQPDYPDRAYEARAVGTVELEITIDETGIVDSVRPLQSLPGTGLDAASILAVLDWRFEPADEDGRPVRATGRAPITFATY